LEELVFPSIGRFFVELFCSDENGITNDMSIGCHSVA